MKIALDAMGGDKAPVETVKGAVIALDEIKGLEMVLVGKKELIENELKKYKYDRTRVEIVHTDEVIEMDEQDSPAMAVKKKKNASMNIALQMVKEGKASGAVSAGNTGALMSASLLKLGRVKGVMRPAITAVLPAEKGGVVLLDAGANADCKPEYLEQFGKMGSLYAEILMGKSNPRVGLLNIGEEKGKGNEVTVAAYDLLEKVEGINFIGNIEARDIMGDKVDVVVTDGFTGNMILKMAEGTASFVVKIIKENIKSSFIAMIGAMFLIPVFKRIKKRVDYSEYGGALFLGLNGISIKSHGSSDAKAIKNGIKVAYNFAEKKFVEQLERVMKGEAECQN